MKIPAEVLELLHGKRETNRKTSEFNRHCPGMPTCLSWRTGFNALDLSLVQKSTA